METANQVILYTGNSQMSEIKIHRVGKNPARTSKIE